MADSSQPILTLLYRGRTHKIPLEGTQANLQVLIETATEVPTAQQDILYRGRKLTITPDAPVEDLNLDHKAMLLRKPPRRVTTVSTTTNAPTTTAAASAPAIRPLTAPLTKSDVTAPLRAAETTLITFEAKLKSVQEAVNRHTQGFLDREMTNEALEKDSKELRIVEEGVMRLIETLDGMPVPEESADVWRAERRSLVRKAQGILGTADRVHDKIRELREDRWGEVESRRGTA